MKRPSPSHPAAQALLAGLLQGQGERDKDQALLQAGKRLEQRLVKPAEPGATDG